MTKDEMKAAIVAKKDKSGMSWEQIAAGIGMSSVWTASACLGMNSMDDPGVAEAATRQETTRTAAGVELALPRLAGGIMAIGNAPTALLRLLELLAAGAPPPALVVGLPVGFVNAAESKEALTRQNCPFITALGPKGGSAVAAAVINALAVAALKEMDS